MKIFTDFHHGDLYHSLQLLFEDRLGYELYRPIGLEWFSSGFWKIGDPYPNPLDTAKQYLALRKQGWKAYVNLNGDPYVEDDVYHVWNPLYKKYEKAITLDKFKEMKFDIIMPTFPGHDIPYRVLRDKFHPKAKMLAQLGNFAQRTELPNVLHSSAFPNPSPGQRTLFYHQEIDPNLFRYTPPDGEKRIYSVVNLAPDLDIYNRYKGQIQDADWKYYGAGSPDGPLAGAKGVSEQMKLASIGWHIKQGVGHSTRGWLSIGRPLVTKMSIHRQAGGDALKLLIPGITCLDLEAGSFQENIKKIKEMLEPQANLDWSRQVRKRFEEVINYDRDGQNVKRFLENLR